MSLYLTKLIWNELMEFKLIFQTWNKMKMINYLDGAEVVGSDGDRDANKLTSLSPGLIILPHPVAHIACGLQHSRKWSIK